MIRVRDDDVLLPSSSHPNPEKRFKKVHSLITSYGAHHVPAILCGSIQNYPEVVKYIKQEMAKELLTPELHGWNHIDYGTLSKDELFEDLGRCYDWFLETFNKSPSIFYTPWGSNSPLIYEATQFYGMKIVDCSQVISPRVIQKYPKKYQGNKNIEIFIHWWEGMGRLKTALRILNGI